VIPAILAAPIAESVAGSVLGTVGGAISSLFSSPSSSRASAASFAPMLRQAATQAHAAALNSPMGTMTSNDMAGLSGSDLHTWMTGLTGKHVQAVDSQGHTVSGIVEGCSQTGAAAGLNVNGHLLSLSNLSQLTWSPAVSNR
jgi:hypothetical protein